MPDLRVQAAIHQSAQPCVVTLPNPRKARCHSCCSTTAIMWRIIADTLGVRNRQTG